MEPLAEHVRRLGALPAAGRDFIDVLDRARLTGRGGAGFPVAAKWRAVAARSRGGAVVVVNGAEGEPQSKKDRLLMAGRPHLILDGAFTAARVLRAHRVVLYIGEEHHAARAAMLQALGERTERHTVSMVAAPSRYVSGESSAAVHLLNEAVATPTTSPPSPHEQGVQGRATLVQNVETLAHVALAARGVTPRTHLVTLAGGVSRPGVLEVDDGTTVAQAVEWAGGATAPARAVLLGGYFGSWVDAHRAWDLPIDGAALREKGLSLGCGVIGLLPGTRCGVCETAGIMHYLAGESSAQCGPCFYGLRALSDACSRIAHHGANEDDLARLRRWAVDVKGRGACKHPDGAVQFLQSALVTFDREFATHVPHARHLPVRQTA